MKRTDMALSILHLLFSFITLILVSSSTIVATAAFDFKVGDEMGWRVPPENNSAFYNYWASINRFQVGDSLSFEYSNDSVLMVEKWDYYHCNASEPIMAFNNGKGTIKLDRPGPFYFISGFPDHCKNGQRLLVEVMSLHPAFPSPPATAAPPESYPDGAPSPSPNAGAVVSVTSSVLIVLMAAFGMSLPSAV